MNEVISKMIRIVGSATVEALRISPPHAGIAITATNCRRVSVKHAIPKMPLCAIGAENHAKHVVRSSVGRA